MISTEGDNLFELLYNDIVIVFEGKGRLAYTTELKEYFPKVWGCYYKKLIYL